jgi:hypothetical protein
MTGIDGGDSTLTFPSPATSFSFVVQARLACPLIHMPHDPQIALRHAQRTARLSS